MKSPLLASLLFVLGAGSALAQLPRQNSDFQSAKVIQTEQAVFPESLISQYRNGGHARVEVSIGADGKLGEWLVTGYTHPLFAESAVSAIKELTFEPAKWRGDPVPVCLTLTFNFEVKGVVISLTPNDVLTAQFNTMLEDRDAYSTCTLRDLDRIPVPRTTVAPVYPKELADRGDHGEISIDFYIDEKGNVRMPYVRGRTNIALANLAVDAVRQWTFEPPTRNGRPVLVHVRQLFRFNPEAKPAGVATTNPSTSTAP